MGIRFFCPNGHRLNVKSFLAGKRGVCPDCGIGFVIPHESDDRAVSGKKRSAEGDASAIGSNIATAVMDRPTSEGAPIEFPPAPTAVSPSPSPAIATQHFAFEPATSAPITSTLGTAASYGVPVGSAVPINGATATPVGSPVGAPAPATIPSASDPIAEAPMAIWYVRPSGGGQYGPARGDVMRKWLTEGRVTTDSLVWREGWPDWRTATKVFPTLGAGGGGAKPAAEIAPIVAETPRRPIRPARKPSTASGIGIVVALGLVCVGLFAALIYVLVNSGATPAP